MTGTTLTPTYVYKCMYEDMSDMVQCTIDGGERGRDGKFKRNEEVRVRGEFEQQQEDLLWLERYKKNVKARGHAL